MPGETELSRSTAALIRAHWSSVVEHLPPPGVAWKWDRVDIPHKVLYAWKPARHSPTELSLVYRSPGKDQGWWMTSKALWEFVQSEAGEDEQVGDRSIGQELMIDVDGYERSLASQGVTTSSSSEPRDPAESMRDEGCQETLRGSEAVEDDMLDGDERDRLEESQKKREAALKRWNSSDDDDDPPAGQMRIEAYSSAQMTIEDWVEAVGSRASA